jgi:hypothetical protein
MPFGPVQYAEAMQSLSVEQVVLQTEPPHLKFPQEVWLGVGHVPAPSQKRAEVAVEFDGPSVQNAAPHWVEFGQSAQALPSCLQLPFGPHVDWADAVQATSQHTFTLGLVSSGTQCPLTHWPSLEHVVPLTDRQLPLPSHT